MTRPRLPGWLLGTVRTPVPKINIWLGLLGIAVAYAGMFVGSWLLLSIGIGTMSVMPIGVAVQWLMQQRFERKIAHWPVHVQVVPGPEGERIAFITATDGTVSTLLLPDDYDPSDDDGEWFIRQVAPDLAEGLYDEEDDDAESL